jgi:hypothetical protein
LNGREKDLFGSEREEVTFGMRPTWGNRFDRVVGGFDVDACVVGGFIIDAVVVGPGIVRVG